MRSFDPRQKFKDFAKECGFLPGTPEYDLAVLQAKVSHCKEYQGVERCAYCPRVNFCSIRQEYKLKKAAWRESHAEFLDYMNPSVDGSDGSSELP